MRKTDNMDKVFFAVVLIWFVVGELLGCPHP